MACRKRDSATSPMPVLGTQAMAVTRTLRKASGEALSGNSSRPSICPMARCWRTMRSRAAGGRSWSRR